MRRFPGLFLSILLTGCVAQTAPSNFYILNSLYSSDTDASISPNPDGMAVGFGPVDLPDHLDRPQIVTRENLNQLDIDEFHRWGGELKSQIERVMAQNLSFLLNTNRVHSYPWPAHTEVRYQVRFDLLRMDGTLGKEALVRARWEILYGEEGEELVSRISARVEPVDGPNYRALVAAQSRALVKIAGEVAERLKDIDSKGR